ncbi:hypothetical protein NEMIN01_2090 [Nematocida minor]|uniref:uncharacterized protein n=1 Tax=Nematocida minor TaxID=1912983 RepID=UPI00222103EB|nr:uncharacterized protein NEMIN01_2090 [Nematocida minor]KAI5192577.1 hypothetical protein NEMIN01_2090 [Nematocida minor]
MSFISDVIEMLPTKTTIIQSAISNVVNTIQVFVLESIFNVKMESGYKGHALKLITFQTRDRTKTILEIMKILGLAFAIQNVLLAAGSVTETSGDFITTNLSLLAQKSTLLMILKEYVHYFKIFCSLLPIIMVLYYTVIYTIENTNRARTRKIAATFISMGTGVMISVLMIGNYLMLHSEMVWNLTVSIFGKTPSLVMFNFLIFYTYSIAESICLSRNITIKSKRFRDSKRSLLLEGVYLFILAMAMSMTTVYMGIAVSMLLNLFRTLTKKISQKGVCKSGLIIA